MGNHVSKNHRYIDATKVFCPAPTPSVGDRKHLNSTLLPNNVNAPTEWTYLVTDGSDNALYLKA